MGILRQDLYQGGDKQRVYTEKSRVGSPTCKTESILITSAIDGMQNRDVSVVDIPNAFVQTEVKETIIVAIRGKLCEFLIKTSPEKYKQYIIKNKTGRATL